MPIKACSISGKRGWKFGRSGKCYTGVSGKARAKRQMKAILASGWTENAGKKRRPNPLRADPTRTASLRRRFAAALKRKFRGIAAAVRRALVEQDQLGMAMNARFTFPVSPERLQAFTRWLKRLVEAELLDVSDPSDPNAYWRAYVEAGYRQGAGRAFDDVHKSMRREAIAPWYEGSREEFLRSAFGQPVQDERVKLLAGRVFTELQGISDRTGTEMARSLTESMTRGRGAVDAMRDLQERAGLSQERALLIARTECLPGDTLVNAGVVRAVFRRPYVGDMIEVETRSGRKFSATPNHPMLARRGWVPAGLLNIGDYLICDAGQQDSGSSRNPDVEGNPATLSEIFDAVNAVGILERARCRDPDFHGDGFDSDVEIASADRPLVIGHFSAIDKPLAKQVFTPSGFSGSTFCSDCGSLLSINKQSCLCWSPEHYAGFGYTLDDAAAVQTGSLVDRDGRLSSRIARGESSRVNVGPELIRNASVFPGQELSGRVGSDDARSTAEQSDPPYIMPGRGRDFFGGHSPCIEFDEVSLVRVRKFSGHVYNLETPFGYYTIDSLYTGNTIRAHAEGQLAAMEEMGVEAVGVMVEWDTAHDDRVCEKCADLQGVVLTLEEARGMIPRHPNCRCSYVPANVGESEKGQKRTAEEIGDAVADSVEGEKNVTWQGAELAPAEARPTSTLNVFCPTGEGGGIDPTCSPSGTGVSRSDVADAENRLWTKLAEMKTAVNLDMQQRQYMGQVKDFLPGVKHPKTAAAHIFYDPSYHEAAAVTEGRTIKIGPGAIEGKGSSGSFGNTFVHEVEHLYDQHTTGKRTEYSPRLRQILREVAEKPELRGLQFDMGDAYYRSWFSGIGYDLSEEELQDAKAAIMKKARESHTRNLAPAEARPEGVANAEGCGAGAEGNPGFQEGNTCGAGEGGGDDPMRKAGDTVDLREKSLGFAEERSAATKLGNALSKKTMAKLTKEQKGAVAWYRDGGYRGINNSLRTGKEQPDLLEQQRKDWGVAYTNKQAIEHLDSVLSKAALDKPIAVYRGIRESVDAERLRKMQVGDAVQDSGFLSTSLSPQSAYWSFAYGHKHSGVLVRIELPKGFHAAYISGKEGVENEVLLQRNSTFEIHAMSKKTDERGKEYQEITLRPRQKVENAKSDLVVYPLITEEDETRGFKEPAEASPEGAT